MSRFGLAPDGVYMAPPVTSRTVVSYTAFPPLRLQTQPRFISVALSLELPPPDVIRRPALWSPDFPHLAPFGLPAANTCFTCVLQYSTGNFPMQVPISPISLFSPKFLDGQPDFHYHKAKYVTVNVVNSNLNMLLQAVSG